MGYSIKQNWFVIIFSKITIFYMAAITIIFVVIIVMTITFVIIIIANVAITFGYWSMII